MKEFKINLTQYVNPPPKNFDEELKNMKDNFSAGSDKYAKYRPTYPAEFFEYLKSIVPARKSVWDCGTGNGQVAFKLAGIFDHVFATDISQAQIDNARQAGNIILFCSTC